MKYLLLFLIIPIYLIAQNQENQLLPDYQVMKSKRFDFYFSDPFLEPKARKAGRVLEKAYDEFSQKLAFSSPPEKISVFLYSSKGSFQKTAISSTFGISSRFGFSEPLRRRIVLWISPSERENIYQLRLNLAHIFIFQNLFPDKGPEVFLRYIYAQWMTTGLALYLTKTYNPFNEAALQDALFSGKLRPLVQLKATSYLDPRELPASFQYMAETFKFLKKEYGLKKLQRLFKEMRRNASDWVLTDVYGLTEEALHQKVMAYLKKKWQKEYLSKKAPDSWAKKLTKHESYYPHWNFGPAVAPDGSHIVFLSDRRDIVEIYKMSAKGTLQGRVIKFDYGWGIDKIDNFEFPPSYSPDGKWILVKAQHGFYSKLFLIGTAPRSDNVPLLDLQFDDYAGACFAPDAKSIVFVGIRAGNFELYRYYLSSKKLEKLTNDGYAKFQPSFSRDGSKIAYIAELATQRDIFIYDLSKSTTLRLKRRHSDEGFPQFTPNGDIIFTSDYGGFIQLGRVDARGEKWWQLSDTPGAILTPALSPDGRTLYFSYYFQGRMHIYQTQLAKLKGKEFPRNKDIPEIAFAPKEQSKKWKVENYETDASADYFFPLLVFNAFKFSDIAGTHQLSTSFGIFSGAFFDPNSGGGDSGVGLEFGAGASITYTFARFLNLSLFANADFEEEDDDDDNNNNDNDDDDFDYQMGGVFFHSLPYYPTLRG